MAFDPFHDKPGSATLHHLGQLGDGRIAFTGTTTHGLIETPDAWVEPLLAAHRRDPATAKARGGPFFAVLSPDCRELLFSSLLPGVRERIFAVQGGKVLLGGKALQREDSHDLGIQPLVKDALQKRHGGGRTDGYLMLVEAGK